jgi:hypothetical protein
MNQYGVLGSEDASDHRMPTSPHSTSPKDEPPLSVPQLTVQHDFLAVADDVRAGTIESEDFWVSVYHSERPSIHGKVRLSRNNNSEDETSSLHFEARDGVIWHGSSIVRDLPVS